MVGAPKRQEGLYLPYRRMRIIFFLRHFPSQLSDLRGGTARAVGGVAASLAASNYKTIVLTEHGEGHYWRDGYEVVGFSGPKWHRAMWISPGIKRWLSSNLRPDDKLILNGIFHPGVSALAHFVRGLRHPYFVAPHDPYAPALFSGNAWLKKPYWIFFERPLLAKASGVIVAEQDHAVYLRQKGISTPILKAGNGYNPEEIPPESTLTWSTSSSVCIGYLGRIDVWNKGLDILVRATAQLPEPRPRLVLRGLGFDSREALQLGNLAKTLSVHCEILPPEWTLSGAQLTAECDLFCLPSRFEGFGLAALEAMLAARPVVVSNIGGIARHVQQSQCGLVVDPTPESLSAAFNSLLSMRGKWKEMGLAGRRYALSQLSWDAAAKRLVTGLQAGK